MAQTDYKERHDKVGTIGALKSVWKMGIQHAKTWYEHNAEKVGRNKEISGNKVTNKEGARKRIEKEIERCTH